MNKLAQLEQKGALCILMYLLLQRAACFTKLKEEILTSGQTAVYNALRKLSELNLIHEAREYPYNKRVFSLTGKGKRIAKKLKEILDILTS